MTTTEHPHRLQITPSDAHVLITHDGVELADTHRAVVLKEGSLPIRYYVPRDDVRMELLTPTDQASHCPFKGDARYWSIDGVENVVWCYEEPIEGAEQIAGLLAFYNDKVDIEVDGQHV
jgi:uncharacterized protein (DUF427 family)